MSAQTDSTMRGETSKTDWHFITGLSCVWLALFNFLICSPSFGVMGIVIVYLYVKLIYTNVKIKNDDDSVLSYLGWFVLKSYYGLGVYLCSCLALEFILIIIALSFGYRVDLSSTLYLNPLLYKTATITLLFLSGLFYLCKYLDHLHLLDPLIDKCIDYIIGPANPIVEQPKENIRHSQHLDNHIFSSVDYNTSLPNNSYIYSVSSYRETRATDADNEPVNSTLFNLPTQQYTGFYGQNHHEQQEEIRRQNRLASDIRDNHNSNQNDLSRADDHDRKAHRAKYDMD